MFTRRLTDGRTLTLEVGEHPDEPGRHTVLATIDGTLTAWGRPHALSPGQRRQLPNGYTHTVGRVVLLEEEAESLAQELDAQIWQPEGLDELHRVLDALEDAHARVQSMGEGDDTGVPDSEVARLSQQLDVLREEYPAAVLVAQAREQAGTASWSDPTGKAAAARECLAILRRSRGADVEGARAALAHRRPADPWL